MALTLGNWIFIGILAVVGVGISLFCWLYRSDWDEKHLAHRGRYVAVTMAITIVVIAGFAIFFHWRHTSTASGVRAYKDFKADMGLCEKSRSRPKTVERFFTTRAKSTLKTMRTTSCLKARMDGDTSSITAS